MRKEAGHGSGDRWWFSTAGATTRWLAVVSARNSCVLGLSGIFGPNESYLGLSEIVGSNESYLGLK